MAMIILKLFGAYLVAYAVLRMLQATFDIMEVRNKMYLYDTYYKEIVTPLGLLQGYRYNADYEVTILEYVYDVLNDTLCSQTGLEIVDCTKAELNHGMKKLWNKITEVK